MAFVGDVGEAFGQFGVYIRVGKEIILKPLGRTVHVRKIYVVHETQVVILVLEFLYQNRKIRILLPRGDLKKQVLLDYANTGLDALEHTTVILIRWIQKQEEALEPAAAHKHVGWDSRIDEYGELKLFYKCYKGLGFKSKYLGDLIIKPTGTLEEYVAFFKQHILKTPLELAVAVGLSSVLVGLIGVAVECDNLFVHIYGDTSSGKTTFAVLAVSMGSRPLFKGQTLARRFNGTENALLQVMVGNTGLPVCFDEAKSMRHTDFSSFIYSLESGVEKLRLDKNATVKNVGEYHTSIVSTGEFSLSEDSEHAGGKEIRLQQFGNIPWTSNATEAEIIKSFAKDNYGLPCVLLAKHLLKIGKDDVIDCFNRNRQKFIDASKVRDAFTGRLSIKYGMILATVELANEAMGLGLSYNAVLEILVQNESDTAAGRDLAQMAYDYILGQVNINIDKFTYLNPEPIGGGISPTQYNQVWGLKVKHTPPLEIDGKKCTMTIFVQQDKMVELLQKGNFKDASVIITQWKKRNLLDHEKGRNTRYRKISPTGTQVHVYGIRVFGTLKGKPKKSKKPTIRKLEDLDNDLDE